MTIFIPLWVFFAPLIWAAVGVLVWFTIGSALAYLNKTSYRHLITRYPQIALCALIWPWAIWEAYDILRDKALTRNDSHH